MTRRSSSLSINLQLELVPCPPELADRWYAGLRAWWGLIKDYEYSHASMPVVDCSNGNSRRKNREVHKITAIPYLTEGAQKTSIEASVGMSHNSGLCDANGPDQGRDEGENADYLPSFMSYNTVAPRGSTPERAQIDLFGETVTHAKNFMSNFE